MATAKEMAEAAKGLVVTEPKFEYEFVGIKVLKAEPMTRGDYNMYRGWAIPENEDPEDDGFVLQYPDGYISWTPAEEFKKHYAAMSLVRYISPLNPYEIEKWGREGHSLYN